VVAQARRFGLTAPANAALIAALDEAVSPTA
jgi:uncharacterized protein (DUF1778 family)